MKKITFTNHFVILNLIGNPVKRNSFLAGSRIKSVVTGAIIAALVFLGGATPALAHVLEFNNGVGAVLHIDPQDDPVAREQTTFYFKFRDQAQKFDANNCKCSLKITNSGNEELLNTSLKATAPDTATASYVFPNRGVYTLLVTGEPETANAFASFRLSYTVRVDQDAKATSNTDYVQRGIYLTAAGAIAVIIFLLIRQQVVYSVNDTAESKTTKSVKKEKK